MPGMVRQLEYYSNRFRPTRRYPGIFFRLAVILVFLTILVLIELANDLSTFGPSPSDYWWIVPMRIAIGLLSALGILLGGAWIVAVVGNRAAKRKAP